jgi:hypothetical protein
MYGALAVSVVAAISVGIVLASNAAVKTEPLPAFSFLGDELEEREIFGDVNITDIADRSEVEGPQCTQVGFTWSGSCRSYSRFRMACEGGEFCRWDQQRCEGSCGSCKLYETLVHDVFGEDTFNDGGEQNFNPECDLIGEGKCPRNMCRNVQCDGYTQSCTYSYGVCERSRLMLRV